MTETTTTTTIIATGNTYPHRAFLKDDGWKWNLAVGQWEMSVESVADGRIRLGNGMVMAKLDQYGSRVRAYTRRQCDITVAE